MQREPVVEESQCCVSQSQPSPSSLFSLKKTVISDAPTVLVDFEPVRCEEGSREGDVRGGVEFKAYPVFNDDGQYFTPSFMLHHDKARTPHNLPAFYNLHLNRIQESMEEGSQLLVPRPSKTNSFCCICKTFFEDYLEHLSKLEHIQLMQKNKFWKDIHVLCNRLQKENKRNNNDNNKKIKKNKKNDTNRTNKKEIICRTNTQGSSQQFWQIPN